MNILFISPSSPRESVGGVERYIVNLIDFCKNRPDLNVKIILPTFGKEFVEQNQNITIYFSHDIEMSKDFSAIKISKKARSFSQTVKKIIVEEKIDIICAEDFLGLPPAFSILLNMISEIHKVPIVLRLHRFTATDLQIELVNQLMWNKISCVSISVAGDCFTKGASVDLLSTEYLGVNTAKFNHKIQSNKYKNELGLNKKNQIVLTACRIISRRNSILVEKGIINLIEAFSKIAPRYDDLRLLIAVAKPPQSLKEEFKIALEMLNGYIHLHNIEKQAIVKIFDLDEMPMVYRESNLFVLASQNETFGQVFIEAMACGTPVIGTKVGGIPEIISDSYNGFLVAPDDASILAQKIELILNNKAIREKFIKAGIETVQKKFTLDEQFTSFFDSLKKMIGKC